jgi:hypothetical protein
MKPIENAPLDGASLNFDEAPIAELALAGIEYRVDLGHGSAVAISKRNEGKWDWQPLTEGRWDGTTLRAKSLDYALRAALSEVLAKAMKDSLEGL